MENGDNCDVDHMSVSTSAASSTFSVEKDDNKSEISESFDESFSIHIMDEYYLTVDSKISFLDLSNFKFLPSFSSEDRDRQAQFPSKGKKEARKLDLNSLPTSSSELSSLFRIDDPSVFEGAYMCKKSSKYDVFFKTRFCWINAPTRTLHWTTPTSDARNRKKEESEFLLLKCSTKVSKSLGAFKGVAYSVKFTDRGYLQRSKISITTEKGELIEFKYGVCAIIGHGISPELFDDLLSEGTSFFSLPNEEKLLYNHGKYGHPLGGYTPPKGERVTLSLDGESSVGKGGTTDPLESFVFTFPPDNFLSPSGNISPIQKASEYYSKMTTILKGLHLISSRALGLGDDFIHKFYMHQDQHSRDLSLERMADVSLGALRLTHYFVDSIQISASDSNEPSILYGAHTDYLGFTILKPDKKDWRSFVDAEGNLIEFGGLEVFVRGNDQEREGRWMPVKLPDNSNALVINAGDIIQRWTNDRWHSPLHRVIGSSCRKHPDGAGQESVAASSAIVDLRSRWSLVFFSGPLADSIVEVLDSPVVVGPDNPPKYEPIRSGDYLQMKLNRTN